MSNFIEKNPEELSENMIRLINKDWALVTAKHQKSGEINTMTASWGCFGELWSKPVFICYIRPQRHTFEMTENSDRISLSFFDENYRGALKFCGSRSGRDVDKFKETGLHLAETDNSCPYISDARLVFIGRKLYEDDIKKDCFTDPALLQNYKNNDFHKFYVCEIEKVLVKE